MQAFLPERGRWILVSLGIWNLSLNLKSVSSSKEHTSLRAWKALNTTREEDEGFQDEDAKMALSTSMALSLDDKLVSNSLDLTSADIALTNLNQSKD